MDTQQQLDPRVKLTLFSIYWPEYYVLVNGVLRGFIFRDGTVTESVTNTERKVTASREDATWHSLDQVTVYHVNRLCQKYG